MVSRSFLAFDLGAESGRAVLGTLDKGTLVTEEISRFPTGMSSLGSGLYWDIVRFYDEMKRAMRLCAGNNSQPESIAVDTWGVDFGFLADDGSLLSLPRAYRDRRNDGAMEEFFRIIPREKIYRLTGIQFLSFNSLYQLYSLVREDSPLLRCASKLLFIPDIFNYFFTGERKTEFSFATTSQLYNPEKKSWETTLLDALGVRPEMMQKIVNPGAIIGNLSKAVSEETLMKQVKVVATVSHDTGAAVASVPAEGDSWAYISSGTWSLVGVETKEPVITDNPVNLDFTNEGGAEGTFRFLRNVMGLWLIQRCRKEWAREREYSYEELVSMAGEAQAFRTIIDPDCRDFLNPDEMPKAIAGYSRLTEQPEPRSPGEYVRCIIESLSLKYRYVIDQLSSLLGKPVRRIHIIGGGVKNRSLNQFTADATGLPVITGPVEATAIGNILVQALGLGYVNSLEEIRQVVRNSVSMEIYESHPSEAWEQAYSRFKSLISS